jgi:hypothetical protein
MKSVHGRINHQLLLANLANSRDRKQLESILIAIITPSSNYNCN